MKTIWLVEDDKIQEILTTKIIKACAFAENLFAFPNGEEALSELKKAINYEVELPDLILLDIHMPVLDAWGFLDAFDLLKSALSKTIPIFIYSSSEDLANIERAYSYDTVKEYLAKPSTVEVLKNAVAKLSVAA